MRKDWYIFPDRDLPSEVGRARHPTEEVRIKLTPHIEAKEIRISDLKPRIKVKWVDEVLAADGQIGAVRELLRQALVAHLVAEQRRLEESILFGKDAPLPPTRITGTVARDAPTAASLLESMLDMVRNQPAPPGILVSVWVPDDTVHQIPAYKLVDPCERADYRQRPTDWVLMSAKSARAMHQVVPLVLDQINNHGTGRYRIHFPALDGPLAGEPLWPPFDIEAVTTDNANDGRGAV